MDEAEAVRSCTTGNREAFRFLVRRYQAEALGHAAAILGRQEVGRMEALAGWPALRAQPMPVLRARRAWAETGMTLGLMPAVIVPTVLMLNLDRVRAVVEALKALQTRRG